MGTRRTGWIAAAVAGALASCGGEDAGRAEVDTDSATASTTAGDTDAPSTGDDGDASSSSETDATSITQTGGSSTGGDPSEEPACAGEADPEGSALAFDGEDDHVTMGPAPELGLQTFTIEAWVRRDGAGQEFGTGAGGVQLVPIAGKGRGENDDTVYNCNYAFGFQDNVLGADFEDSADGSNHPVVGTTPVPWGQWHHVAATYDGTTWRLYVDGQLDTQVVADATPRFDSIQHFAIGTAMDSTGAPVGRLHGALDELRVWNYARSDEEITGGMYRTISGEPGLVGRWALDESDGGAPDSEGEADGTVQGAAFVTEAPVLDRGVPPVAGLAGPADGATLPPDAVELGVTIADPDSDEFEVSFSLREVAMEDDFTVVVLPDTQYYSDGRPDYFHAQTQWVMDNREAYNILAVIHNGDIVNHGSVVAEWQVADAAMSRLETPLASLPDGLPYGVCVGNHDQDSIGEDGNTATFNDYFGVDRFDGRAYYGGHYADDNDENWFTFSAGGLSFVVVDLQFDRTPDPGVLAWARSVFEAHPDAFGVLNTHFLLNGAGSFGTQGQAIYDALADVDNVQLMTSGHISAEALRTDVHQGNVIHTMLADYQADGDGGSGYLRLWEFSPASGELTVRTYSPVLDDWYTDADSEFTLEVELPGAGEGFAEVMTVDPAGADVTATVTDLQPGTSYEWYAEIHDCAHTVRTGVSRFTTAP